MTDRKTHKRRLERAGFTFYSGWLPTKNPAGLGFAEQVAMFREDVDRISAESMPRGRKGKPQKPAA